MSQARSTQQREAIQAVLERAVGPLLPEDVLAAAATACPGLGQATVYRELKRLRAQGRVREVRAGDQRARFEMASEHHHHFHCGRCDRVYDIEGCVTPQDLLQAHLPQGFHIEDHEVVMQGTCPACAR